MDIYSAVTPRSIAYICDECGRSFDLIKFKVDKGEPDHNGLRLISVRTIVREIVEHVCKGRE